jgi:SRSO17 transposase
MTCKVDNGQVAVFSAPANGQYAIPVDVRLHLPEQWTDDLKRFERAGEPEDARSFRTKTELGLKIVRHGRRNDLRFGRIERVFEKGKSKCAWLIIR